MASRFNRRDALKLAGGTLAGEILRRNGASALDAQQPAKARGTVIGQPEAAKVGAEVLAAGGNAVDAAVAAALVAGVVAVRSCGIGGYGGHMVIALAGSKKVTAIDFNTTAPKAARPDMFPVDEKGVVKGQVNELGWLAAGVPGTLAGLQMALDRYGTQPFPRLVQPAIRFARDGFEVNTTFAAATRAARVHLAKDPASARLLLDQGEPLKSGHTYRNPDLADMLQTLAERKSVDSFYRGDIAQRIAAEFKKHGGLVTAEDLAAHHAREVEPLVLNWRGFSIHTAPLTAGGATVLEALSILKALNWDARSPDDPTTTHTRLEALRLAWADRLSLLGDPEQEEVPLRHLLSEAHAKRMAARVESAVRGKKPVPGDTDGRPAGGTIHLSAADAQGNLVALTLTHGNSFGAMVTVDGLGLVLGHGMLRFDPRPGRPNSPGPGKRPLHNMCPTIVLRDGRPILAVGATGGRRIPNTIFDVLTQFVGRGRSLADAVAAPRLHTEGDRNLIAETRWPEAEIAYLKQVGYKVKPGAGAVVQAVSVELTTGEIRSASR